MTQWLATPLNTFWSKVFISAPAVLVEEMEEVVEEMEEATETVDCRSLGFCSESSGTEAVVPGFTAFLAGISLDNWHLNLLFAKRIKCDAMAGNPVAMVTGILGCSAPAVTSKMQAAGCHSGLVLWCQVQTCSIAPGICLERLDHCCHYLEGTGSLGMHQCSIFICTLLISQLSLFTLIP